MSLSERGLGRSLAKVFAKTEKREQPQLRGSLDVETNLIVPSQVNPRRSFGDEQMDELIASVGKHGVLQPILVLKREAGYEILAGERRWRAAKAAGLAKVPVVVKEGGDARQHAEWRLIENVQREDLDPMELARAYQALIDEYDLDQAAVAEQVGKSRSAVANTLRLLQLPQAIQQRLVDGSLAMGQARALIGLPEAVARELAERIVREGLSARSAERLAREAQAAASGPTSAAQGTKETGRARKAPHLRELEQALGRLFDADVAVSERGGRGKLSIRFHSKGHFQAVVRQLEKAFEESRVAE